MLKAADDALAEGNAAGAAELYAQLLAEDSANVHALAGLARCYVETGALEQAKQTLALVPEAKRNEAAVAAARAALDVAEQAKSIGPLASSKKKSPPIRSIIRRASILPSRSTPRANAKTPSII